MSKVFPAAPHVFRSLSLPETFRERESLYRYTYTSLRCYYPVFYAPGESPLSLSRVCGVCSTEALGNFRRIGRLIDASLRDARLKLGYTYIFFLAVLD